MAYRFGSDEWARALTEEINDSSEYRNAASRWGSGFNGNMLLAFEADAEMTTSHNLLVRLAGGRCNGAEFVDGDSHPDAGFSLRAPFGLWRSILERKTMAATAILTGKLKLDGDKLALLKHTAAHRALIHCTSEVETLWD